MAGDWLKIEVALPDKPEVWQIAGILGIDPDAVVGKLLKVWRWFDSHTEDGNANGVTYLLVDAKAGVTGFAEAMSLCGWLEQKGSVLSLPNFDRHNGKTAKNRALTAVRVANSRKQPVKSNAECNAANVTSALAREEKRREEERAITETVPVSKSQTFSKWIETIPADVDAIPLDHHVFAYADSVKLPRVYLALAWVYFEKYYTTGNGKAKKYKSWPDHFRTAVESGYGKLWGIGADGSYYLTTAGKQLQLEVQS
jgi:hypothetical protein